MTNPYSGKPDTAFWSRSVAALDKASVDPVLSAPFKIFRTDRVATAGSCFAQHIARTLVREGFDYMVTEPGPAEEGYGLFPARFANIYSTLQLLQLFQRAYGLFAPEDSIWTQGQGFVDSFRPFTASFDTITALEADRAKHLAAVRTMFEGCDVFIFTLGLTETWISPDGAAVPSAPGIKGTASVRPYNFSNRSVADMTADLTAFIDKLRTVNPSVRIILTVSPVPLVATFEDRHVLVSTIYSKSALRVVAEQVSTALPNVAYFPSYEIITGHHAGYSYFAPDLREVMPEGVDQVMGLFKRHYLAGAASEPVVAKTRDAIQDHDISAETQELYRVVCDEEAIDA